MTPRDRIEATLSYARPDRLPVIYHPSTAGLHVHGEKLLDLFRRFPPDNPVSFTDIPAPDADSIAADGRYHGFVTDEWGTTWEHRIFGIAGHPYRYPVGDWDEADQYRLPAPPPPSLDTAADGRHFVTRGGVSIFERLHALHPFDGVLIALAERRPGLLRFLDRLEAYWAGCIDRFLGDGADAVWFGDDWGTQAGPLVSPALFRDVFLPVYARLFARVKEGGAKVLFHSCGALGPIYEDLVELGIDLIWPQIRWFESDPARFRECRDRLIGVYVHPDRQRLIPMGTPAEIRGEIRRYAELGRQLGGGVVFYVEIENDAPFGNVKALIEAIDEYR